eukprot:scaffold121521_cov48-Phaeocystis_antarctica.AAC.1
MTGTALRKPPTVELDHASHALATLSPSLLPSRTEPGPRAAPQGSRNVLGVECVLRPAPKRASPPAAP